MRSSVLLVLSILFFLGLPRGVDGQAQPGHVYLVLHWKANPGSEAAYSQAYREVVRPVWTQVRRQGGIVSFLELSKNAGSTGDATHLILTEFEDWEAYGNFGQELEEASQVVFSRPWAEVSEERFVPLRVPFRSEIYVAPPGGM